MLITVGIFFITLCLSHTIADVQVDVNEQLALIERRLSDSVLQDKERCHQSDWAETYTKKHKSILESENPRILVAVPHLSGMADRIVGMTSTLMFSILTDRAFQIGRRGKLPLFESAFNAPNINWTRAADPDWLIEPLREKANPNNYNSTILESKKYYAVNTIDNIRLQDSFLRQDIVQILGGADIETTMLVSNRGKTIRIFENSNYIQKLENMKLNPYTAFGCLVNYIIQPKKEIFLPIYEQFEKITIPDPKILKISIQIRTGDQIWTGNTMSNEAALKHSESFFQCAEQIESYVMNENPGKYNSVVWYLASDSKILRQAAVEKYGEKVITGLHSHIEHSAKEQSVCAHSSGSSDCGSVSDVGFHTAAAEWWLLGYAEYHVITLYSGYGRSGAYRTYTTDRIWSVDKSANRCHKGGYSNLEEIMYDWAGI